MFMYNIYRSGAKLPPAVVRFDASDPLHLEYVTALANMRAAVYRVPVQTLSVSELTTALSSVPIPTFRYLRAYLL